MTAKRKTEPELSQRERDVWARFDTEIQIGLDDVKRGALQDADEVFDRLEAKYRAMSQRHE